MNKEKSIIPIPKYSSVTEAIDNQATKQPQKKFVLFPHTGEINYETLQHRCRAIVDFFERKGLKKGDIVTVALSSGEAAIELFLALQYGGFIVSFLNLIGKSQWEYILSHSQPQLIIADPQYIKDLKTALPKNNTEKLNLPSGNIIEQSSHQSFYQQQGLTPVTDWVEKVRVGTDDPSILMYTSGTTGYPKGVLLSQKNSLAGGRNTALAHELNSDDIGLCVLPLYHINAQMVSIMSTLVVGATIVLPPSFKVSDFWSTISHHRCTWFSVVPTQINYLLHRTADLFSSESGSHSLDISSLRFGRSASAPLSPEVHKKFENQFGINLVETMGLTETAAQILSNPRNPSQQKYGSPGQAVGNEVRVVDEKLKECLPHCLGEVAVRGDNVMLEYLHQPEVTAETIRDGWLLTGDLGFMDEDGFVFITGRKKEIIIKGGENIAPREIDDVLYTYPDIVEAASFAMDCPNYGQRVEAAVVTSNKNLLEADLLKWCEDRLGSFKSPDRIYFLTELPKGPSGKIQRNHIPKLITKQ